MLELTRETREKLRRYLINADPFLWGVLNSRNKNGRIRELKSQGYLTHYPEKISYNYSKINQDLLVEVGVEGILENIIVPKVHALFTPEILEYFRRCWEQGQTPTMKYLRQQGLYKRRFSSRETYDDSWHFEHPTGYKDPPFVFVQIHTQQNFVERWTVFAGLWFEEIQPLLESVKET